MLKISLKSGIKFNRSNPINLWSLFLTFLCLAAGTGCPGDSDNKPPVVPGENPIATEFLTKLEERNRRLAREGFSANAYVAFFSRLKKLGCEPSCSSCHKRFLQDARIVEIVKLDCGCKKAYHADCILRLEGGNKKKCPTCNKQVTNAICVWAHLTWPLSELSRIKIGKIEPSPKEAKGSDTANSGTKQPRLGLLDKLKKEDFYTACGQCTKAFKATDKSIYRLSCECKHAYHPICIEKLKNGEDWGDDHAWGNEKEEGVSCPKCNKDMLYIIDLVDGSTVNVAEDEGIVVDSAPLEDVNESDVDEDSDESGLESGYDSDEEGPSTSSKSKKGKLTRKKVSTKKTKLQTEADTAAKEAAKLAKIAEEKNTLLAKFNETKWDGDMSITITYWSGYTDYYGGYYGKPIQFGSELGSEDKRVEFLTPIANLEYGLSDAACNVILQYVLTFDEKHQKELNEKIKVFIDQVGGDKEQATKEMLKEALYTGIQKPSTDLHKKYTFVGGYL